MYKILIADDEGIVVQALEYIIKKNFGSQCEVVIAKNGRQAIELAERHRPDIALMDIQMPGINGLKALEEIHARDPKIKTLILTAYDNFDYAKTALRLGALDYLNKPINKTLLVERLTEVMREIDGERRRWETGLQEKEKLEAVGPIVESNFVLSLMIRNENQQDSELCRRLLDIDEAYGTIMVLEYRDRAPAGDRAAPSALEGAARPDGRMMAQIIKVYFYNACVSSGLEHKAVCVIPQPEALLSYESRTQVVERAKAMAEELKQKLGLEIKVGIGSVRPWDSMYESYQEALNALRHGKWTITHIDDLIVEDTRQQTEGDLEQAVVKAVMSGMEHEARREATVFAGWIMKHQEIDPEAKKLRLMEVCLMARRRIQEENAGDTDGGEELKKMLLLTEEAPLCSHFVQIIEGLARSVVIRQPRSDSVIVKAQEYIRRNFHRDLPLEEVACQAGISPYYFSRMFKEETGTNYSEYLTEVRMETAKQLLMNPAISIKQVCIQSGYTNPNYFSRIFKKCTGITPTEFRSEWLTGNHQ